MAEEIIDLLVKIPGVKVISRTSSFQFKGKLRICEASAAHSGSPMCCREACEVRETT